MLKSSIEFSLESIEVYASLPSTTSHCVGMSMMEDTNCLFPLFSSSSTGVGEHTVPGIDFNVVPVPGSPEKFIHLRKSSLSSSQFLEEPLFSLFLNGAGFDDSLLQAGMVPDSTQKTDMNFSRQYVSIVPDGQMDFDMSNATVPSLPSLNAVTLPSSEAPSPSTKSNSRRGGDTRKRRLTQTPKAEPQSQPQPQPATHESCSPVVSDTQLLSPEEERNMKRQRRLVKNREAAQLFRQRQKAYIHDLEKKVTELTVSNNEFKAKIELLNSENKLVKEQLLYLRNFVTQAVSIFPKTATTSPSTNLSSLLLEGPIPLNLPPFPPVSCSSSMAASSSLPQSSSCSLMTSELVPDVDATLARSTSTE